MHVVGVDDALVGNEEDLQMGLGITGPKVEAKSKLDPETFFGLIEKVVPADLGDRNARVGDLLFQRTLVGDGQSSEDAQDACLGDRFTLFAREFCQCPAPESPDLSLLLYISRSSPGLPISRTRRAA